MPRLITVIALLLCATQAPAREAVATSEQFAFYSDFETNLNDALVATGVARRFGREELFLAGDQQECFDALEPALQAGWRLAVGYYAENISPHQFNEREQYLIRLSLAGTGSEDARDDEYLELVAGIRRAAAPAYEACRWTEQDAANRRWIDDIASQLAKHEQEIAARLARLYQQSWPGQRMDVDVVETVNWAGANSFFAGDSAGHLLVSSASAGHEALETVFHEASHGFMLRPSPLQDALDEAAATLGVPVPDGLWHVVLFVTTGEIVRGVLADAGEAGYEPMIYEIYGRSRWGTYREAMDVAWPAYLDGRKTALEAAAELLALISRRPP